LIAAAATIIAKKGLAATSVEKIAAKAGYTRGAFYSNFSSKVDLFVELLRRDHQDILKSWRALLEALPFSDDPRKPLASLFSRCCRDGNYRVIWTEACLHATRDAKFRQCVSVLCLEKQDVIAQVVERLCQNDHTKRSRALTAYVLATMALMDGAAGLTMIMPSALLNATGEVVWIDLLINMLHEHHSSEYD